MLLFGRSLVFVLGGDLGVFQRFHFVSWYFKEESEASQKSNKIIYNLFWEFFLHIELEVLHIHMR